ncbi:methyltransferase domain-containing protein [Methylosinus sp. Sm6]|uniref:class I SAM-dependent methyltransferase n=1 Tax=Methylosinus sp. Sm6 TaxID=2866948 RepID=UPI001C9918D2|nr:methyltransferase domain-containing protein [Methylosinus sp. Sm6]MBY6240767.1 methyltransferase domain-containing protein [Methylosinus sp. Sm6]
MDSDGLLESRAYYEADFAVATFSVDCGLYAIEKDWIARYFPAPPARVLDIACGSGRTTRPLADGGYDVHGLDISFPLLAEARRRSPGAPVAQMNAQALGFADAVFDAALFSVQGLDHLFPLAARLEGLAEIFRVLRPGGVLIMSTHNLIGEALAPVLCERPRLRHPLRLLGWQLGNRHLSQWYARYVDEGGAMLGYAAPPSHTKAQLEQTGFTVRAVTGANWTADWDTVETRNSFLRSTFVYFAAQKPAAASS